MSQTPIDINSLTVPERIQLVEDLWDSIAATDADLPLTRAQADELERRLDDLERDPDAGVPWETARARLEERFKRET